MSFFKKLLPRPDTDTLTQITALQNLPSIPLDGSTIRVTLDQQTAAMEARGSDTLVYFLSVSEGAERGRRIEIGPSHVTLGRAAPADIVLQDTRISRQHAALRLLGERVMVRDLGSTNGSFIDGVRVEAETPLGLGSTLVLGNHCLTLERRSRREFIAAQNLDADFERATHYMWALLPPPINEGAVRAQWVLKPSAKLGGDALGYHELGEGAFAFYLLDVTGHGVGAAMHAVSVLNVIRQQALPHTDFRDPAAVLTQLNETFPMDAHDGMCLTMWYGVYEPGERLLKYASAGHHPGYLRVQTSAEPELHALRTRNLVLGAMPGYAYKADSVSVPPEARIYLFSDGAFEIETQSGQQWGLQDFVALLSAPEIHGLSEPERLQHTVLGVARSQDLDDDFSVLIVTFA